MRLADDISVTVAGEEIILRPSLRFAMRLERRPGSFQKLTHEVMGGSYTAALDILGDHLDLSSPHMQDAVFNALDSLRTPLLAYIGACMGIDSDAPKAKGNGGTITFAEHLTELYRTATGWLSWSPQDTLDATPAEIMEAYRGRMDMLKAIFGGNEKSKPDTPASPEQLSAKFAFMMRARAAAGKAKA